MNISLANWKVWAGGGPLCVCVSDLMTHLWLRVTLGSGLLKREPAALTASEHM